MIALRPFDKSQAVTFFLSQLGTGPSIICSTNLFDDINDNFTLMIAIGIKAIGPIRYIWTTDIKTQ
ncbi:hypothetical protein [Pseudomonas synxantha]|uniref:hypothetical protein n=1 Tax=Pseudomonas synxantha TaxID=47883 RepID=UPI000F575B1C|nr:hypothetical protein [Pseudomonas synxantha]AZE76826.1 hypothetical protein C4J99_1025 [Pseudomonas synxantha]